ncbi:MAG: hypothetical protein IPK00_25680 [Deltaproteobacteria bacterium]|nr:hypothetical protein [Deltaproteobacteria bacterium]
MNVPRLLRLLVSFPIALLLGFMLIASTAALVSAVENRGASKPIEAIRVELVAESCDVLRHELHALSHAVSPCELPPDCQGSPLLCPIALDARIEREYARLRDALHDQCGLSRSLVDFAWDAGEQLESTDHCGVVHDGFEAAARGEARPTSYSF